MSRSVQFIAVVVAVAHKISTAPKMWRPQWWSPADTDDIILPPSSPLLISYLSYGLSQASSSILIVCGGCVGIVIGEGEDTSESQYYTMLHCTYS